MPFGERQWNRLLTDIEDHQIVPVIGPEVLLLDAAAETLTVATSLARRLVERLGLDSASLPAGYGLNEVVNVFLRQPDGEAEELYFAVREAVGQAKWPIPRALKQLAAIRHFDLYLSITFDSLLEQALNEVRFGGAKRTRCFANSRSGVPPDLPAEYRPAYDDAAAVPSDPAVYHLFGKINPLKDYALREEDIVQFCFRLQSRDLRPQNLFDFLRTRNLLVLGCGFPGWLTRFFLAAAKGDQLFTDGARGVIADSVSAADPSLVYFLERRKTIIYTGGDAQAFIDELSRRWTDRFGEPEPPPPPGLPDLRHVAVFVSYASEDRPAARMIRDSLNAAGLDVWFDERQLDPGDPYRDKILRSIEQSAFFIPVISRHTAIAARRFFFLEWSKAVDEAQFRPANFPFIQPVVIDDTSPGSDHIPALFCARHWQKLEGDALPDHFCQQLKKWIRDLRRGEGANE